MATPVEFIKNFVDALTKTTKTGIDAVDEALSAVGMTHDYSSLLKEFNTKGATFDQDFLEQDCGVRLNNTDTGAITGSDAGGKTTKTAESIVPENGTATELTDDEYNSFTKNGLKVNVTYNDDNYGLDDQYFVDKQKLFTRALYNWWLPEALELIDESLGINFTDGRANVNEINVEFSSDNYNYVQLYIDYDLGRAANVTLRIPYGLLKNFTATDKNGTLDYAGSVHITSGNSLFGSANFAPYLDQLILQALAEVALRANVSYVDDLPEPIARGLAEIVGGYDAGMSNLGTGANNVEISSPASYGYALVRYLAKNYSSDDELPAGLSYNTSRTMLTASSEFTGTEIDLANFDPLVKTVDASATTRGINIVGNELANSLKGGSGADTLTGGAGNDTLTGGNGNDVFIYDGKGTDVITDYTTGDQIRLSDGTISNASLNGSDVVMKIGSNTLTVKNGKDKSLTWIDTNNTSHTTLLSSSTDTTPAETPTTLLTVTNSTTSPVTVDSEIVVIDATSRTSPVQITGNASANTIRGGSGNDTLSGGSGNDSIFGASGNDVINGDAGNDTLTGGDGNDVFIYDAGNDIITDYATGDQIRLSDGTISNASLNGSDVVMRIGNNTLTVKNGKGKSLTWVDTNNTSHTTLLSASSTSTTTSGGSSSSTTKGGGSSTSTTTGGSSSTTKGGGSSTSTTRSGGVYTSSGTSSTSTTRYGGSTSTGTSSTSTTRGGTSTSTTNQNVYTGGDKTISNYLGQPITIGAYTGSTFDDNGNFFVGSPTGTLVIQNAADKIVDLRDGAGNAFVKAYQTSSEGVVDGRGLAGYEIIDGASTGSNVIFAGDGGSQLWGGSGLDADALVGGNGADIFNGGRFQGSDNIFNASSADVVNLTDATLSDIVATVGNNNGVAIGFNTGNVVNIQSTEALSAAINLADGSSWRYNHVTKGWQSA